jgi:hypothetical protein
MTTPEFPRPHPYRAADDGAPEETPALDPTAFIAPLTRSGNGAAADGQPWPERHQMPGRRMALADADCALAGRASRWRCCWRPSASARTARTTNTWAIG